MIFRALSLMIDRMIDRICLWIVKRAVGVTPDDIRKVQGEFIQASSDLRFDKPKIGQVAMYLDSVAEWLEGLAKLLEGKDVSP